MDPIDIKQRANEVWMNKIGSTSETVTLKILRELLEQLGRIYEDNQFQELINDLPADFTCKGLADYEDFLEALEKDYPSVKKESVAGDEEK